MDDQEIARIWAENFPRRRDNALSRQLCALICRIVEQRCQHFGKPGIDEQAKAQALESFNIREWEFELFLNER